MVSSTSARLYDTDFYGWIQNQAAMLRGRDFAAIDLDNLIEEVESMGRSEKRELENRVELLLMHLLKWAYQPNFRSRSWQLTIKEQRRQVARHLRDNPSLKSLMPEIHEEAYQGAIFSAAKETGMDEAMFPAQCPWTFEQAMDAGFWPERVR